MAAEALGKASPRRRSVPVVVGIGGLGIVILTVSFALLAHRTHSAAGIADDKVNDDAQAVATILANSAIHNDAAIDIARSVDDRYTASVLEAHGSYHHGGAVFVVRLSESDQEPDGFGGTTTATVTHCYRYDVSYAAADDPQPTEMPCPNATPLAIPPAPPQPQLGDLTSAIPSAINSLSAQQRSNPEAVRSVVASTVSTTGAVTSATEVHNTIGVAISLGAQCVLVRLESTIDVWYPPSVLSQPGEDGCTATDAAEGLEMNSPH